MEAVGKVKRVVIDMLRNFGCSGKSGLIQGFGPWNGGGGGGEEERGKETMCFDLARENSLGQVLGIGDLKKSDGLKLKAGV